MFIRSVSSLVGGIVIGMIYSWKLTLVFMAFAPFMIASGFLEMSLMKGSAQADKEALESAGKVMHLSNIGYACTSYMITNLLCLNSVNLLSCRSSIDTHATTHFRLQWKGLKTFAL